jgi:hypothetical protein
MSEEVERKANVGLVTFQVVPSLSTSYLSSSRPHAITGTAARAAKYGAREHKAVLVLAGAMSYGLPPASSFRPLRFPLQCAMGGDECTLSISQRPVELAGIHLYHICGVTDTKLAEASYDDRSHP